MMPTSDKDGLFFYTWKVGNFVQLINSNQQVVRSPSFTFTTSKGCVTRWHVRLTLSERHEEAAGQGYVGIFLSLDSGGPLTLHWLVTVVDGSGVHQLHRSTSIKRYPTEHHRTGWSKYVAYRKLHEDTSVSTLLPNGELTLHISIQLHDDTEHHGHASRKFSLTQFTYVWEVGPFAQLTPSVSCASHHVHSPRFVDPSGETRWHMTLYPRGKPLKGRGRTAASTPRRGKKPCKVENVALDLELDSKDSVTAKWSTAVIDAQGHLWHMAHQKAKTFTTSQCTDSVAMFVSRQTLLDEADRLLPSGVLTLYCHVEILGESTLDDKFPPSKHHLSKVLSENAPHDLVLEVDGVDISVHRTALAASSPVFAKMLEAEMREARLGRVHIEDFHVDVVRRMVQFIYDDNDGVESADLDTTDQLLQVADKYEIESLHSAAQRQLALHLSVDCAVRILVSADRHQAPRLLSHTTEFIRRHALQVMTRAEWAAAIREHSHLIATIHEQIAPQLTSIHLHTSSHELELDCSEDECKPKRQRRTPPGK